MADTADAADAAAQRASEQARLRKERREAKLKSGGSARLNKISGMGGRVVGDNESPTPSSPAASPAPPAPNHSDDPEEVDISQHFYTPNATQRGQANMGAGPEPAISEAQLRQMMLGFDQGGMPGQGPNPAGPGGPPGMEQDPLMQMMSQMMAGGGPGGAGGSSPFPGMPPMPGMPGMGQQAAAPDPNISLWKLLHALVALGLGVYIAILTPFTGTKVEREREALSTDPLADEMERHKRLFFWVFATAEVLLLSTRFMLVGPKPPSGMMGMALGFLPGQIKGYVEVILRYGQIFSTVRADILACMFVLGVCSWWRA